MNFNKIHCLQVNHLSSSPSFMFFLTIQKKETLILTLSCMGDFQTRISKFSEGEIILIFIFFFIWASTIKSFKGSRMHFRVNLIFI